MGPSLQSLIDAAEENFRSQQLEEAIQHAILARDYIDQLLITYHAIKASRIKIDGVHDWYAVLSIQDRNADAHAIKNAYEKLVLKVHPDKNSSTAANDAFKLVLEARNVLLNPDSRRDYDLKRGSTPPWKQHETDTKTATNSSKGPAATSEPVSTNSGPWWFSHQAGSRGTPTSHHQATTSEPMSTNSGPWWFGFQAGWSGTPTSYQATTSNNIPGTVPNSSKGAAVKSEPVSTNSGPWWFGYQAGGAPTSYEATSPNNTRRTGRPGSWRASLTRQEQYGQGPTNNTQFITPPVSVLLTGLCHNCQNQLTPTSIPPGGTRWAMSCTRCNWSFFP